VRYTHGKPEILEDSKNNANAGTVYVVFTRDPDPNKTRWYQKGVFKDKKLAIEKAKSLEAKGFSVFVSEEYKGDDYGDGETVYDSEVDFFKEGSVEESFKSKDKYSVLREALDRLDREEGEAKRAKTKARIKSLRSRLRESEIRRYPIASGGQRIQLDSGYSVFPINGGSENGIK
jgi:hypothetical protein